MSEQQDLSTFARVFYGCGNLLDQAVGHIDGIQAGIVRNAVGSSLIDVAVDAFLRIVGLHRNHALNLDIQTFLVDLTEKAGDPLLRSVKKCVRGEDGSMTAAGHVQADQFGGKPSQSLREEDLCR